MLEYLDTFQKFEFLWRDDKSTAFKAFLKKQPTIDDYEFELARFSELEDQIMKIDEVYNLSCMSLRTQSLKYSLKAEVTAWKAQYSKRMHKQAQSQMNELVEYLQTSTQRLSKEVRKRALCVCMRVRTRGCLRMTDTCLPEQVSHVDDVGNTLKWLRDLRTREADLEQQISPIEGMYYIMRHHYVRLPKEETDMLFRLRLMWKELLALGQVRSSKLSHLQAGFRREVVRAVKSFSLEVMQFCNDFDMNGPMVAGLAPMEAKDRLNKYTALFGTKRDTMKALQEREMLFGLVVTEYEDLSRVQSELGLLTQLYDLHTRVETSVSSFSERLWTMITPSVHMMSKTFSDLQADLHALPRVLREWPAYDDLAHTITDFISVLPVVSNLCHPGIRRRHWMQVVSAAGQQTATFNIDPDTFKLKHLLSLKPVNIRVEIDEICRTAKKELEIEAKVQGLGEQWTDRQFQFVDYKNRPGAILDPTSIHEIIKSLDESITDLTAISSTKIAEALSEEVDSWMAKLSAVSEVIESWSVVQTKWTFMETIFSDPTLSEQLPQDAKRFSKVDTNYMKLISRASHNRHVINCCNSDHQLKSLLPHLMEQLEQCERSLASYLQGKRASFPRFYFVSDHVLLDFLTRTTKAAATELQGHLSAIFSGITGLRIKHHEDSELGEDEQEFPLVRKPIMIIMPAP
jgi:dynein heavy chain